MSYDKAATSLNWNIPADAAPGARKILISVTVPGKAEDFRTIDITVGVKK
jgi:hypothetical protein